MQKPLPILRCSSQTTWASWLEKNEAKSPGVWLRLAKKNSGKKSVTYAEAVESALCFGWIDGQSKSLDADYWLQKFTPRRKDSLWSEINRAKALALIEQGRMQPGGHKAIEQAKANGRWDLAYGVESTAELLPEFEEALAKHPKAEAFYRKLDSKNRYAIFFRLRTAKKLETRAARMSKIIGMLERGERIV